MFNIYIHTYIHTYTHTYTYLHISNTDVCLDVFFFLPFVLCISLWRYIYPYLYLSIFIYIYNIFLCIYLSISISIYLSLSIYISKSLYLYLRKKKMVLTPHSPAPQLSEAASFQGRGGSLGTVIPPAIASRRPAPPERWTDIRWQGTTIKMKRFMIYILWYRSLYVTFPYICICKYIYIYIYIYDFI